MALNDQDRSLMLLLHADGVLLDSSAYNIPVRYASTPGSFSSTAKFGAQSFSVLGVSSGAYKGFLTRARVPFSGEPFTLEAWCFHAGGLNTNPGYVVAVGGAASAGLRLGVTSAGTPVAYLSANSTLTLTGATNLAAGQWHHLAVARDAAGTTRFFVNGNLEGSTTSYSPSSGWYDVGICTDPGNSGTCFNGHVDEVRYLLGQCAYTANFTPPASAFSGPTTTQSCGVLGVAQVRRGNGRGRISGDVKEKGTPNAPLRRRTWILRERDGTVLSEQWSDSATGVYSFPNIDPNEKYTVLAFDHTQNYRAVIADNLTPDLML